MRGVVVRGVVVRGDVVRGDDVVEDEPPVVKPGSVVIAMVPSVVRSHAVMALAASSVAAATRTRVLIWATIGGAAIYRGAMSSEAPSDEVDSAEACLAVLQSVLARLGPGDLEQRTPCREFDVAGLTDHLMNSITVLGGAAGAALPERDPDASVESEVMGAAYAAVAAWRARGVDGAVPFGSGEAPARMMAGILSLEFLVHAWDYAEAIGAGVEPDEALAEYVLGLSNGIIKPEARSNAGFDPPVDPPAGAGSFDRLLAFTGRRR